MALSHTTLLPQRGTALVIVLAFTVMASLLALWTFRMTLLNETMAGNHADYQRTFEAAQTLMQDAENDIRQINAPGNICASRGGDTNPCPDPAAGLLPTHRILANHVKHLDQFPGGCSQGICRPLIAERDFWRHPSLLLKMTAEGVGARYGQFTGAPLPGQQHPLLAERSHPARMKDIKGAWYWIEIIPHAGANTALLKEHPTTPSNHGFFLYSTSSWIYRITVYARGRKSGTEVVLQSVMALQPPY